MWQSRPEARPAAPSTALGNRALGRQRPAGRGEDSAGGRPSHLPSHSTAPAGQRPQERGERPSRRYRLTATARTLPPLAFELRAAGGSGLLRPARGGASAALPPRCAEPSRRAGWLVAAQRRRSGQRAQPVGGGGGGGGGSGRGGWLNKAVGGGVGLAGARPGPGRGTPAPVGFGPAGLAAQTLPQGAG